MKVPSLNLVGDIVIITTAISVIVAMTIFSLAMLGILP